MDKEQKRVKTSSSLSQEDIIEIAKVVVAKDRDELRRKIREEIREIIKEEIKEIKNRLDRVEDRLDRIEDRLDRVERYNRFLHDTLNVMESRGLIRNYIPTAYRTASNAAVIFSEEEEKSPIVRYGMGR
jgi:septal ring factor EnvC (AmiA/AmiB activator)